MSERALKRILVALVVLVGLWGLSSLASSRRGARPPAAGGGVAAALEGLEGANVESVRLRRPPRYADPRAQRRGIDGQRLSGRQRGPRPALERSRERRSRRTGRDESGKPRAHGSLVRQRLDGRGDTDRRRHVDGARRQQRPHVPQRICAPPRPGLSGGRRRRSPLRRGEGARGLARQDRPADRYGRAGPHRDRGRRRHPTRSRGPTASGW